MTRTWLFAAWFVGSVASAAPKSIEFTDIERQTREFVGYYHSIKLTPKQEKLKAQVLKKIPAPCCSQFSALTCCCPCNFSKALWGLSHHLIARRGYGEKELEEAVKRWIAFTHPGGYSGRACYNGGCARPFVKDGCGGMSELRFFF